MFGNNDKWSCEVNDEIIEHKLIRTYHNTLNRFCCKRLAQQGSTETLTSNGYKYTNLSKSINYYQIGQWNSRPAAL